MNVLWIEDDINRIRGLLNPLKKHGVKLYEATNYKQAIEFLNSELEFKLVVVDLIIPRGVDYSVEDLSISDLKIHGFLGIEICKLFKEKYPNTPIVVISVVIDDKIYNELLNIGVVKIFRKGSLIPSELKDELIELIND